MFVVDCQTVLEEAAEKILSDIPSFLVHYFCTSCNDSFTEKRVVAKIHLENWKELERKTKAYANPEIINCQHCNSLSSVTGTTYSDYHIFLCPTFNFEGNYSENPIPLKTIPGQLAIDNNVYILTGAIAYDSPGLKKTPEIGHFVAFTLRQNQHWEIYDDRKDRAHCCKATHAINIHGLYYRRQ